MLLLLQLINEDVETGKLVFVEDSNNDSYVAIGEVMASDYTPERVSDGPGVGEHKIQVILNSVTKPHTILPFKLCGTDGTLIYRTLGEAFSSKKGILWLLSDTVLTQPDRCIVVKWD